MAPHNLLDLPKELRLQIYGFYFISFSPYRLSVYWKPQRVVHDFALLRTSKLIHYEAIETFHKVYKFTARIHEEAVNTSHEEEHTTKTSVDDEAKPSLKFHNRTYTFLDEEREAEITQLATVLSNTRNVLPLFDYWISEEVGPYHLWSCFVEALRRAVSIRPGHHVLHFYHYTVQHPTHHNLDAELGNVIAELYLFERLRNISKVHVDIEVGGHSDCEQCSNACTPAHRRPLNEYAEYIWRLLRSDTPCPDPDSSHRNAEVWEGLYSWYCDVEPYNEQLRPFSAAHHVLDVFRFNICRNDDRPLDVDHVKRVVMAHLEDRD